MRFFFEEANKYIKTFYDHLRDERGGNEYAILGGAELFDKYGMFNIIEELAQGDITKFDSILSIDCATALIKLKLNQDKSEYERRLHRHRSNQAQKK